MNIKTPSGEIPKTREFYSKIISNDGSEVFFNCRILNVEKSDNGRDYQVDFIYEDYDILDIGSFNETDFTPVEEILKEAEFDTDLDGMSEDDLDDIYDMVNGLNTDTILFSEYRFIR